MYSYIEFPPTIGKLMNQSSNRLSQQLLVAIEERIVAGEYSPGARIDEADLAISFGVSRTPIREALIRLGAVRMVKKTLRKGWVVAPTSPRLLCEMFESMGELEALCGRLAARHATPFQQQKLLAAHEACRRAQGESECFLLDEAFHHTLYQASGNEFLVGQTLEMQRRIRPFRRLQLSSNEGTPCWCTEHEQIVAAILSNDADLAVECLRRHYFLYGTRFTDLVGTM